MNRPLAALGLAAVWLGETRASFPDGGSVPPTGSTTSTTPFQPPPFQPPPPPGSAAVSTWWIDHTVSGSSSGGSDGGGGNNDESDDANEDSSSDFEDTWKQPPPPQAKPAHAKRRHQPPVNLSPSDEQESSEDDDVQEGGSQTDEPPLGTQPLQTLEKLQQMLDETDYMTTMSSSKSKSKPAATTPLWTSRDRAKYKKQQIKQREAVLEQQKQQRQLQSERKVPLRPPSFTNTASTSTQQPSYHRQQQTFHSATSSDEEEDLDETTDDGLGYVLPDLPIYFSDDEGDSSGDENRPNPTQPRTQNQLRNRLPNDVSLQPPFVPGQTQALNGQKPSSATMENMNYPLQPDPKLQSHSTLTDEQIASLQQRRQTYYASPPLQHQETQQRQQQLSPTDPHYRLPYPPQQYYGQISPPYQYGYPQNGYPVSLPFPPYYPYPPPPYGQTAQQEQEQQHQQQRQQQQPPHPQQPSLPIKNQSFPKPYAQTWRATVPQEHTRLQSQDGYPPYHFAHPLQQQQHPTNSSPLSASEASSSTTQRLSQSIHPHPLYTVHPRVVTGINPQHHAPPANPGELVTMTQKLPEYTTTFPGPIDYESASLAVKAESHPLTMSNNLNFSSVQKMVVLLIMVALFAYSAVSPRTLPLTEYNVQFYENLRIAFLSTLGPAFYMVSVFDAKENDVNAVISTFFHSFVFGYALTFLVEIVATTLVRLAAFYLFERDVFYLAPNVPIPVLPWVLREINYRPKRITLFSADFGSSCVAAPIIEEAAKLLLLSRTATLPRNFKWVTKLSSSKRARKKRKRRIPEAVLRNPGESDCVNANRYITHMLAASLGLKLADAGRRIFLYTKPTDRNKSFYAICRGIFPIHELCGTITALALAKRDLLGVDIPLWKVLGPAVVIHGMANFRGMKPIFKWNSATPWSEMQMWPWNFLDITAFPEIAKKVYGKLMWAVILTRVLGYCVKNYYMVNRKAVKRTTKYAGNHAAFSAELATADLLIKSKKK